MNKIIEQQNVMYKKKWLEKSFFFVVIVQLFFFALLNYFLSIQTNFLRWGIDACLYSFTLMLIVRLTIRSGFKPDKIMLLYILLLTINALSYVANSNDIISLIKQVRFTFMGGMIYVLLLYGDFSKKYFEKLIRILFFIGYLQLPIVIVQLLAHKSIAVSYTGPLKDYVDYAAGSVSYGDSGVLGTFLVMLSIVKIQQCLTYGISKNLILQILLLLLPLGLINSDTQFFFIPLVFFFALVINKRITVSILKLVLVMIIVFIAVDFSVRYNWGGDRSIIKYMKGYVTNKLIGNYDADINTPLLRFESLCYVWKRDTQNPNADCIIGKGPGYWLTRDLSSMNPITNIWYHCNTVLLMYGELGLLGLIIFLLLPIMVYIDTDDSFWGTIIRIEAFYIFLSLFYHHPLNELSLSMTLMIFIVYYRRFKMKKPQLMAIRQSIPEINDHFNTTGRVATYNVINCRKP